MSTRPRVVLSPKTPQKFAGMRIEPPPVGAGGQADDPGGDRAGRPARRAAGGVLGVPRVAGRAVGEGLGERPQAAVGHLRVADDHRPRRAQLRDGRGVHRRRRELRAPATGGDLAGDVGVVLDRDRHPEQRRAFPGGEPGLRPFGRLPRGGGVELAEQVQPGVDLTRAAQHRLEQLGRRDGAVAQRLRLRVGTRPQQLFEIHGAKP